jgi:hypothetical protein
MSITGVLEELSNTPIPSLANIVLTPSEEFKELINSSPCPPSPSQSHHSETYSNSNQALERPKSDILPDKVLRASGEYLGFPSEDGTDSRQEKKSSSSAMKNIISHFMTASASGQIVQVIPTTISCLDVCGLVPQLVSFVFLFFCSHPGSHLNIISKPPL